ncbi:hypothetical protein CL657_05565 [bacterium]|nr:hypothetical protein [bacterium]|tara:strand:+ start:19 stop:504 length:486 start_codon:yes stop_codon:yes gene_type:complete
MRLHIILCFIVFLISPTLLSAKSIKDITTNDANYKSINQAISKGYLSLYNDKSFKPNTALSRRDAVIIIDKFEKKFKAISMPISNSDLQELIALSKTYKKTYTLTNNSLFSIANDNKMLRHEQKLLLHEITALQAANNRYQKERKLLFGFITFSILLSLFS